MVSYLELNTKLTNEIPNKGWNMADSEMERRNFMRSKHIFKSFSDKITYLIYPDKLTFHKHNDLQGTRVYQSPKEILTNFTFWGRKETSVAAASIIAR